MRWPLCAVLAAIACGGPPDGDSDRGVADDTDDTDAPLPTGATVPAVVTASAPIACAAPDTRNTSRFELRNAPEMPLPSAELVGGGIVAADFTGDELLDIFLMSESDRQFFVQQSDGTFDDVAAAAMGPTDVSAGVGGSAADYDGDGDLDLLVTRFDRPVKLLQNDGIGHFTDVTDAAGIGVKSEKWQSSSWGDFDGDGWLDLVVGAYGAKPEDAFATDQLPGDPKALYRNNGDGTFTDRSDLLPSWVHEAYTFMTAWYDLNGDSYPELFFVNDFAAWRHSVFLWNRGGVSFEMADSALTGFQPSIFGMGFAVGDLNGDQLPDSVITSWKDIAVMTTLLQDEPLPNGDPDLLFLEGAGAAGIYVYPEAPVYQSYGWGADLADLDNDADLDALVGYGWWSIYEFNHVDQPDSLFLNDGTGRFVDASTDPLWDLDDRSATRGVLTADLNRDGWLDVLKRDLTGPTLLRLAECGAEAWSTVSLRMTGPNTRAIGARIDLTADGKTQTRWIESGSRSMYSGGPPEAHFGLGAASLVERIEITWPDGEISRVANQGVRQHLTITR
ncbi:MAG: CRTAC1 family protein [Deltaproteobacteria bacterium]|nr:CRTAC1 family protein [Deltaproteobacteria bacterium]